MVVPWNHTRLPEPSGGGQQKKRDNPGGRVEHPASSQSFFLVVGVTTGGLAGVSSIAPKDLLDLDEEPVPTPRNRDDQLRAIRPVRFQGLSQEENVPSSTAVSPQRAFINSSLVMRRPQLRTI